jgi:hypothetical protein
MNHQSNKQKSFRYFIYIVCLEEKKNFYGYGSNSKEEIKLSRAV